MEKVASLTSVSSDRYSEQASVCCKQDPWCLNGILGKLLQLMQTRALQHLGQGETLLVSFGCAYARSKYPWCFLTCTFRQCRYSSSWKLWDSTIKNHIFAISLWFWHNQRWINQNPVLSPSSVITFTLTIETCKANADKSFCFSPEVFWLWLWGGIRPLISYRQTIRPGTANFSVSVIPISHLHVKQP